MNIQRLMAGEFFKLRKRMMTWILAGLIVGLIILLYSILWSVSARAGGYIDEDLGRRIQYQELRRGIFLQAGVPFALQIIAQFGSLLAVIFAAGAAGSEYSWGTVRLMATASSGRLRLIAARFIVTCALVAIGTLLAVSVALAYSAVITTYYGGADFSFLTASFLKEQFLSWARTIYVMFPFVALAFAAAIIGRSTLAGVGVGLAVTFLEPLIGSLMRLGGPRWESVPNYLISANRSVVLAQNKLPVGLPAFSFGPSKHELARQGAFSAEGATIILAIYTISFIALAFIVYRRRDITSSSNG
jgi:ABC-type transport system involved in multi-copper enzyme maturation permease subunit